MTTHEHTDGEPTAADATLESDLWPTHTRGGGVRMRVPTAVLAALLIGVASAWGGAELQKHHRASATAAGTGASAFAAFRRTRAAGGTGTGATARTGGFGGLGAAGGTGTAGTVTVLQGNTLWLTSATGALVKVELQKATTVTRNADATTADLRPGDTVVVQGSKKGGVVTASSVAATAKGVTAAGFGSFGGFGGGGGTGGTTGSSSTG